MFLLHSRRKDTQALVSHTINIADRTLKQESRPFSMGRKRNSQCPNLENFHWIFVFDDNLPHFLSRQSPRPCRIKINTRARSVSMDKLVNFSTSLLFVFTLAKFVSIQYGSACRGTSHLWVWKTTSETRIHSVWRTCKRNSHLLVNNGAQRSKNRFILSVNKDRSVEIVSIQ